MREEGEEGGGSRNTTTPAPRRLSALFLELHTRRAITPCATTTTTASYSFSFPHFH